MKSENQHFTITKGDTHYFSLTLVVVIAAFVAVMSGISVYYLGDELASLESPTTPAKKAILSLETPRAEIREGDVFPVNVFIDIDLPATGVDVAIKYDPRYIELQSQNAAGPNTSLKYLDNSLSILDIFPYAKLEKTGDMELYRFSALAKPLKEFRGRGVVATLTFRALRRGTTTISLPFEKGLGSDSNVAYLGRDILTGTRDLRITIR